MRPLLKLAAALTAIAAGAAGLALYTQILVKPGTGPTYALPVILLGAVGLLLSLLTLHLTAALFSLTGIISGLLAHYYAGTVHAKVTAFLNPYMAQGWYTTTDIQVLASLVVALPLTAWLALTFYLARRTGLNLNLPRPSLRAHHPLDIEVGKTNGRPLTIKHRDRYLHTLTIGTTGTGKTSRVLKPMVYQDLLAIKHGAKLGITVLEPKGDFAADVAAMAKYMGLPVTFLDPEDPSTPRFNPMEGDPLTVAEVMRTVLRSLFGKQEAFFRQVQEVAARNTVLLLKQVKGDNVTIADMLTALRDLETLKRYVETLERRQGPSALTEHFRQEALGKGESSEKLHQFALGLRLQLEDICGNAMLERILMGKSDIDLDRHLCEGGVLVVNTAMGALGKLGDAFGQFIAMHLQNAVFRRPGTERTRTPHVLYIDEFPRYVNPDFERLLAIGRSYRCATVLALQTTAQLLLDEKPAFRDIVLETCRNKIVLNLGSAEDAVKFAKEFGQKETVERTKTYKKRSLLPVYWEDSVREESKPTARFEYTRLMELPQFQALTRTVRDGAPQTPTLVNLDLCPWDRRSHRYRERVPAGRLAVDVPAAPAAGLRVIYSNEQCQEEEYF